MKKVIGAVLMAMILALGSSTAVAQYVSPEFDKSGKTFRYAWGEFLDAQLLVKTDDNLLQILAIRQGERQIKVGPSFVTQWKVAGLWHAYQNAEKTWISNGVVADLISPLVEQQQMGQAFASVSIGAPRLAAASDSSGRLQAVITGAGEGESRFIYAVRDGDSNWHIMYSNPIPDRLNQPCCIPPADGNQMMMLALVLGGENDSRIVRYTLSPSLGGGQDTFRWTRELFPESLKAASFAALQNNRTFILFLQNAGGANVQAVERDVATGKWNFDPQRFEPSIPRELSRIAPQSMIGFLGQDGLPQVVALQAGGGEQVIVHIYRDEVGLWHNNGNIFNVRNFKLISACPDAQGYINLSGIGLDGRVWHGYRGDRLDWRSNGFVFDSNSR
jgi:hypothetical protein